MHVWDYEGVLHRMLEGYLHRPICAALRMHEIGTESPYRLYFATKGNSGASFGFMQGDLAAGQRIVVDTFRRILSQAGATATEVQRYLSTLSVHLISNPLSQKDTKFVNDALTMNDALVDAMDNALVLGVYSDLSACIAAAATGGREISAKALLYAALWINMSGPPTKLLTWLKGGDPHLRRPVATPPKIVTGNDMRGYLMATDYYVSNPRNAPHLDEAVQVGATLLPPGI